VGTFLARELHAEGREVVVFSRRPTTQPWKTADWRDLSFDGFDVVINLAGRSVNCRYHAENRRQILESRTESTRAVGCAIAAAKRPPRLWLQASTATIYRHRYDAPNDDVTGELGGGEPGAPETWDFSIAVAKAWEAEFNAASTPQTRKVAMRSAMVMTPDRGGVFDAFLGLVRKGLGGAMGDGRQYVSWIHGLDFVAAVRFLIEHDNLCGPVVLASPNPVPNREFMRELRRAAGVPIGLPLPEWMLEIGALVRRTETELVLKSRRVVPSRLLRAGFRFRFPTWPDAVRDLLGER